MGGLGQGLGGWVWCYVFLCCDSGFFVLMAGPCIIMLGGYLRILGAPSVQCCCTLPICAS